MFLSLVKHTSKNSWNYKDSKSVLIFSLALEVAELVAISWFFTKQKLQNISETNAATWRQKLAADFPSLHGKYKHALAQSWSLDPGFVLLAEACPYKNGTSFSPMSLPNLTVFLGVEAAVSVSNADPELGLRSPSQWQDPRPRVLPLGLSKDSCNLWHSAGDLGWTEMMSNFTFLLACRVPYHGLFIQKP